MIRRQPGDHVQYAAVAEWFDHNFGANTVNVAKRDADPRSFCFMMMCHEYRFEGSTIYGICRF